MNRYVHSMNESGERQGARGAQTRRRILQATVALHEEVGPAATTISAIAARAGVQRLTVYRHFPDAADLIDACSAHWSEAHPLPDPARWGGLPDPRDRVRSALGDLYRYYREGEPMLAAVLRDEAEVPPLAKVMVPWWEYLQEVAGTLAAGWGTDAATQRRLRAATALLVRFESWRALAEAGLDDAEAAELGVGILTGLAAQGLSQ